MDTKSAFIAIVGLPNVGKSSLLNAFVGEKAAIVSPKPQTTRTRVTGILTKGETQLVFIDTPGLHKLHTKLSEYMVRQIKESVSDVDLALLVTEPSGEIRRPELELIDDFKQKKIPAILVVNKIDLLDKKELMLDKISRFAQLFEFERIVPISVFKRDGVGTLLDIASSYAKPSPHFFDDDAYTDQTERTVVAEIIREKILFHMRDEVPHGVAVTIESMKERPNDGITDIQVVIFCEKENHKAMLIGKNGEALKAVGTSARAEIERLLDTRVNLQCWVKVREGWRNRPGRLREFGFN